MSSIIPSCPQCGEAVPFSRSFVGRGREFQCRRCGASLITSKAGTLAAIGIFLLLTIFGNRILQLAHGWLIVVLAIVLAAMAEYMMLSVKRSEIG